MKKKFLMLCLFVFISVIFLDIVNAETYNNYPTGTSAGVSCGNGHMTDIPAMIPKVVSIAYNVVQVAVPVVLIIMGSLDLFKAVIAQKEDEIKKGQQTFLKRIIAAILVFFVFVIVKFIISVAADSSSSKILECAECFIENKCD